MRQVNSGVLHWSRLSRRSCLRWLLLRLRMSWLGLRNFLDSGRVLSLLSRLRRLSRLSALHSLNIHISKYVLHHLHRINWPFSFVIWTRALVIDLHIHLCEHILQIGALTTHARSHLVNHVHDIWRRTTTTSHISKETSKIRHAGHTSWHSSHRHTTRHPTLRLLWRRLTSLRLRLRLIFNQMYGLLIFSDYTTKY